MNKKNRHENKDRSQLHIDTLKNRKTGAMIGNQEQHPNISLMKLNQWIRNDPGKGP